MAHPQAPPDDAYERDCVIYLRKSKGRAGISRQRRDNETVAKRLRWRIIAEYVDTDATAFAKAGAARAKRDDYQAMLVTLNTDTRGRPLGVIAWHADRLHRSTDEVGVFSAICGKGGHPVETARSGGYDLTTATGRKRIKQDALDAEFEVDHLVERTEAAKLEAAQAGRWLGGRAPYGYRYQRDAEDDVYLVQVPVQAEAIRWGSQAIVRGGSLRAVAREWNRRGLVRRDGKPWERNDVRRVLLAPRNASLMVHRKQIIETLLPGGKAEWEPIITEELWRAVDATLKDPARRKTPGPTPRWLGSGLYLCECASICRISLSGTPQSKRGAHTGRWNAYRCEQKGPGHVARAADPIDAYVHERIIARFDEPGFAESVAEVDPPDVDGMQTRLAIEEAELTSWRNLAKAKKITPFDYAEQAQAVRERMDAIKDEIAQAMRSPLLAHLVASADVRAAWFGFDLEQQRTVLRQMGTVTLKRVPRGKPPGWTPGQPYWHEGSVHIDWRPLT